MTDERSEIIYMKIKFRENYELEIVYLNSWGETKINKAASNLNNPAK